MKLSSLFDLRQERRFKRRTCMMSTGLVVCPPCLQEGAHVGRHTSNTLVPWSLHESFTWKSMAISI